MRNGMAKNHWFIKHITAMTMIVDVIFKSIDGLCFF
jgi:hypothetical protein